MLSKDKEISSFALHPSIQELKAGSLTVCHTEPVSEESAMESLGTQQCHRLQRTQHKFHETKGTSQDSPELEEN